mmetsp:Transcript_5436/g.14715  ORF Transcript_5436/g.14715 Transcript_5436/m.14715 type:complete len:174 (+) Transcript_5436:545-1066(+)
MPPPGYGPPPPGWRPDGPPPPHGHGPPPHGKGGPGRLTGRIKSFNREKGFGFIDCPEAFDRYQRDVFIHKQQFGDLEVGEDITFVCEPNKDGMPQARDPLRLNGTSPGPGSGGGGKDDDRKGKGGKGDKKGKKGKGKGDGKDKGDKGGGKGKGKSKGKDGGKKGMKMQPPPSS